jgi:Uma2 family endonuclease
MSVATQLPETIWASPPLPVRRFTVDEYHIMIRAGVFAQDERFELLEGWITPKMIRNPPHDIAIELASEELRARLPEGWRIRVQSALTTDDSEPEPDLAVVQGSIRSHPDRHPEPRETAIVIEVADSSLPHDRGIKKQVYARASIPVYWIINLVDARIEVYTDPTGPGPAPDYRQHRNHGADDSVPLVIAGREIGQIAVRDLLP